MRPRCATALIRVKVNIRNAIIICSRLYSGNKRIHRSVRAVNIYFTSIFITINKVIPIGINRIWGNTVRTRNACATDRTYRISGRATIILWQSATLSTVRRLNLAGAACRIKRRFGAIIGPTRPVPIAVAVINIVVLDIDDIVLRAGLVGSLIIDTLLTLESDRRGSNLTG